MKNKELFFIFNDSLENDILKLSYLSPKENKALIKLRDCLYKNGEEHKILEHNKYPEELMKFLRHLIDSGLFSYLEVLIIADCEIVFHKVGDDKMDVLEYLMFVNQDNELVKILALLPLCGYSYSICVCGLDRLISLAISKNKIDLVFAIYNIIVDCYKGNLNNTLVQLAVRNNSFLCLRECIDRGFSLDDTSIFNSTPPLSMAIIENASHKIIETLIQSNADINKVDERTGKTPLDYCVPESELYKLIKEAGGVHGDKNVKDIMQTEKYFIDSDFNKARTLIKEIISQENPVIVWDDTDLFYLALELNQYDVCQLLLPYVDESKYDDELVLACVKSTSKNEKTIRDIIRLLDLINSIWPHYKFITNYEFILFTLAWNVHLFNTSTEDEIYNLFEYLKDNFGVDITDSSEALGQAFIVCNYKYVEMALALGMNAYDVDVIYDGVFYEFLGEFFLNTSNDNIEQINSMCKSFLKEGASINYCDKNGNTVLHRLLSTKYENPELPYFYTMICLKYGANVNLKNNQGYTPGEIFKAFNPSFNDLYYILKMFESNI